jgi:hypothetical protein
MPQAWIVRAGRDDEYERVAFADNVVGVGWRRAGDLSQATTLATVRQRVQHAYPSVTPKTQEIYALQLNAFRSAMRPGDLVVLLRENSPQVALGEIAGDYAHASMAGPRPSHVRRVRWLRAKVPPSEISQELVNVPALTAIYRLTAAGAVDRLRSIATGPSGGDPAELVSVSPAQAAADGLRRNLGYARSLAEAGLNLEKLGVTKFEVLDVYRAAWVQAVASLDHWVHQEIRDRMLQLADDPSLPRPTNFGEIQLSIGMLEDIQQGRRTLREAVDEYLTTSGHGRQSYQSPQVIVRGLKQVANVDGLWQRVAVVLGERDGSSRKYSGREVESRLHGIVQRRHKIAHEYDEDPTRPGRKRDIDQGSTMHTINWIEQIAEAILVVIDGK